MLQSKTFWLKSILFFCFFFFISTLLQAQHFTISGYVTDSKSGETLIGSNIFETNKSKGAATNAYGYYSITLPAGDVNLRYSYVGYATQFAAFTLSKDTVVHIKLHLSNQGKEVVVIGERIDNVESSRMSAIDIPIEQIKAVPMLFGEVDIIKAIQLLPGVSSGTEGSAGMYVRGGGPDENLMLLDGVPVYNVNHAFGFFSVFNADAIKNVTLYKGSFPARFGGRLSSVIDVHMKDGDHKNYHGNVSIGIISSKLNVEGPIIKEKTTFNFSARRTYIDLLAKPFISMFTSDHEKITAGYYFYDLNAKISHKFSDNDRLYFSFYTGDDVVYVNMNSKSIYDDSQKSSEKIKLDWGWGNTIGALRWNHIITNKLFMNTTAAYTGYRSLMGVGQESSNESTPFNPYSSFSSMSMDYRSGIADYSLKLDFDYLPNPSHTIKFGAHYIYHTFKPGVSALKSSSKNDRENTDSTNLIDDPFDDEDFNFTISDKPIYTNETMLYVEDDFLFGDFFKMNVGINYSTYSVQNKFYHSLQPRISFRILLSKKLSFKSGYAMMSQYIHLLANNYVSLPTDLWVPVTKKINPMFSNQITSGFFYNLEHIADLSVEGYYKWMNNLIEYKDGATFMGTGTSWEEKVSIGKGWAYGIEFLAQRSFGKTTGWIGYTWSKTNRLFDRPGEELNNGLVFPAKYDRRHDISITASHKFSERFDLAASWVFSTGNAGTLALHKNQGLVIPDHDSDGGFYGNSTSYPHLSARNNYRFNDYHRMDIGVNFHKKLKRGERTWNISVYNAYGHLNPFIVWVDEESVNDSGTGRPKTIKKLIQVSLFSIIPSVSYTFKF